MMKKRLISLALIMCIVLNLLSTVAMASGDIFDLSGLDELINLLDSLEKKLTVAEPSTTSFMMGNKPISVKQAYMVNGNNYLQLRAIAEMLNGTDSQFNVYWDGKYAVIETGKPYDGKTNPASLRSTNDVRKSSTAFKVDGKVVNFDNVYLIDGDTNYLQLREFASKLKGTASQFNVYWDAKASRAVIVPGAEYTGHAPTSTDTTHTAPTGTNPTTPAPTSSLPLADGWYNLCNVKNGKYVIILSNGFVALEKTTLIPHYYVKHMDGDSYTIQTADGRYLGVSTKASNGTQVKAVAKKYMWTLSLEAGNDTFSLRLAENTKMLFNAAGQATLDGDLVSLWTYEGKDAPNYAEFKFTMVNKGMPAPAEPTPTPDPIPIPTPAPTHVPQSEAGPSTVYTDPDVTHISYGFKMLDAEGKSVSRYHYNYELVITPNITSIEDKTFYNNGINKFTVDAGNPYFTAVDGVLFNKDMTKLIAYPAYKTDQSYTIPDSVTELAAGAFAYSTYLKEIKLSSKLTAISVDAFRGSGLTEVEIPENVTAIYGCAFNDMRQLQKITIPRSVRMIFDDVLKGSNPNVVIYGAHGSVAEYVATQYGYKFVGSGNPGLTTIKLGQTESEAGISKNLMGYHNGSGGRLAVYGSYKNFLAVFYVNDKATFIYTNDLATYTGAGTVYTDSNDNNRKYAVSIGMLPALDDETIEKFIFYLTNAFRAQHGLPSLTWNDTLKKAAYAHSADMAQRKFFDHTNPDGLAPQDRITAAGYPLTACAENIFYMSTGIDPVLAMDGWINSAGHRENLLITVCNEIGVGVSNSHATQNFGRK